MNSAWSAYPISPSMSGQDNEQNSMSIPTVQVRPSSSPAPSSQPSKHRYHPAMANSARRGSARPLNPRSASSGLKLPSLPRFHPANFSSQNSSFAATPTSSGSSPQPPMSPRSQQRQYSEAQKQLYAYQRELLANAGKLPTKAPAAKPVSPRLLPAGSPGPVTPLELEAEQAGGYLLAGRSSGPNDQTQREYVEKLIREEAARRGELSPKRATTVGS